jgi:glycosyltransferase involved in cell wall biosynthesis
LLEAYLQLIDSQPSNIYLIFAGEFSKDEFGIQLKNTILQSKLTNNIRITGYLSNEEYNQYLQISDLAIQLRQFSRGETSKAVLDCLSYGTPVIVNNEATYKDYPDNVVIKINAQPSCNELINSLKKIIAHKELLTQYSIDGLNYVTEKHNITVCAAQYAAIIHECISRYTQSKTSEWIKTFAPILSLSKNQSYDSNLAITWLNNLRQTIFQRRRIFIDVSHIAEFDLNTGIQRVVKKITSALYCSKELEFEPIAVNLINGQLQVAKSWLTKQQLLLPHEIKELSDKPIQFRTGDYFLMLDSSWNRYSEFSTVFKQARNASVPIITVIYDLIPLHLKGTLNIVEGGAEWFEGFFHKAIANSDMLLCISRTVADEVVSYLEQHTQENLRRSKINVDYWHLGADFRSTEIGNFSSRVEEIFSTSSPYLLMVGTIEPRKSHALALEVMEKLWEKDTSLNLCIAGKQGWLVDDLMAKLRLHPFRNIKLFLIEEPTDDEIAALYQNAAALLFLSKMEGFGLPLVEAANYGTPIICSDIPVFREICSEHATYVNIDDKEQLIEQLLAWHEKYKTKNLPDTSKISVLTWEQSAESMVDTITNNQYHWTSNNDYKNIEVV